MRPRKTFRLLVPVGYYEADSLPRLLWEVLCHRLSHLVRGEGWSD